MQPHQIVISVIIVEIKGKYMSLKFSLGNQVIYKYPINHITNPKGIIVCVDNSETSVPYIIAISNIAYCGYNDLKDPYWIDLLNKFKNRFSIISNIDDYKDCNNFWSSEKNLTLVSSVPNIIPSNGAICTRCKMYNPYAESSDSYICYNCRS